METYFGGISRSNFRSKYQLNNSTMFIDVLFLYVLAFRICSLDVIYDTIMYAIQTQ